MGEPQNAPSPIHLRGGLRRRLTLWFLALSILPLLGSVAIGYASSERIISKLVGGYLAGISDLQSRTVYNAIRDYTASLEALARTPEIATTVDFWTADTGPLEGDRLALERALQAEMGKLPGMRGLFLSDARGVARLGVGQWPREATRETTRGLHVVHDHAEGEASPDLELSVPLEGDRGYITAVLKVGGEGGIIEIPEHIAGSIETFILDGDRHPLAVSHDHGHTHWDEALSLPLFGEAPGTVLRYPDRAGIPVLGTMHRLPEFGWTFVTEVPADDALGDLESLRKLSLVLGGLFVVIVAGLAWVVSGGIAAPVQSLVAGARTIRDGELGHLIPVQGPDEVRELTEGFNEMSGTLLRNRRRIEELHAREMTRAGQLATVGELASGVAHEIRNPLVGISNGVELVVERVKDDEFLKRVADEMSRQVDRMQNAIGDLLTFARPPQPERSAVDSAELVERSLRLVSGASNLGDVRVELVGSASRRVELDPDLVGQALVNLVMNAIQASAEGGRVEVRHRVDRDELVVEVEDWGKGIDREAMSEIFKPFFTTRHRGTGLGLAITRQIIESHGGTLSVDSVVGAGTTFTVRIPVGSGAEQ